MLSSKLIPRIILILSFVFFCSSCSAQKSSQELMLRVEVRDNNKDEIKEYRVFDNGLVNISYLHNTNNPKLLYKSYFLELSSKQQKSFQDLYQQLLNTEHYNDFPWKEDWTKRGAVVKIQFPSEFQLQCLTNKQEPQKIKAERLFYHYSGHKDEPKIFAELVNFLETL